MSKKTEKQSRKPKSQEPKAATNGQDRPSQPGALPNLTHIAEALRPLAVPCSSLNYDPENARLHSEAWADRPQDQGVADRIGLGDLRGEGRSGQSPNTGRTPAVASAGLPSAEAQVIERNLSMRLSPKKLAVAQRRQEVASMYLSAEPQWKIAQHFGVHPGQISRDLRAIQKQWEKAALFDLDKVKARELAKLDEIERKASLAWDRSCKDAETMEVTGTSTGGKGKPEKVKKVTKGQAGDPRFLAILLDCMKRRCEILGLDAPKKLDHTTGGQPFYKAYLFDPDNPPSPEDGQPA